MEKKEPKSPVIHPSLAGGGGGGAAAQKGKSRIAPGAQRGYVVHDKTTPAPLKVPAINAQRQVVTPPTPEEDVGAALAAAAPESALTEADPTMAAQQARREETMLRLLNFTKPTMRTVRIAGMDFNFKLLSPAESLHISKILGGMQEEDRTIYRTRVLQLAAGLVDVDGITLESVYQGDLSRDVVLMRYSEVMRWSMPVLDSVLEAYEQVIREVRNEFKPDFLTQPKAATNG